MQADIDAGLFLESNHVTGPHGAGLFGISYAAIAEAAATGMSSNQPWSTHGFSWLAPFMHVVQHLPSIRVQSAPFLVNVDPNNKHAESHRL